MKEKPEDWSDEKLLRKANQCWEMAGLARMDGDLADAKLNTDKAREYDRIRLERKRDGR